MVEPVEILKDDDQGCALAPRSDQLAKQADDDPPLGLGVGRRLVPVAEDFQQRGHVAVIRRDSERSDALLDGNLHLVRCTASLDTEPGAQQRGDQCVWSSLVEGRTPPQEAVHLTPAREKDLLDETAFADSGVPTDDNGGPVAPNGALQRVEEGGQLIGTPE